MADLNTQAVLRNMEADEGERRKTSKPWRTLRLVGLCVAFLMLAGLLTYTGVEGFANPVAQLPQNNGSIGIGVQVPSPQSSVAIPIYLTAIYIEDQGNSAEYQVTVPAKYAGKRYVLILSDTARIDGANAGIDSGDPPFTSRTATCTFAEFGPPPYPADLCQLIIGTFPSEANAFIPTAGDCQVGAADLLTSVPYNAVRVTFFGSPHITISSNWAYKQYALPDALGLTPGVRGYNNQWSGSQLPGWFQSNSVTACMVYNPPQNAELTDMYQPATQSGYGELLWSGTQVSGDAFVMRRRNADEISNGLLAAGAAMAALAIGFIPVAYDANRERRRARNQVRQARAT